jgi:hypothetical protein
MDCYLYLLYSTVVRSGPLLKNWSREESQNFARRALFPPTGRPSPLPLTYTRSHVCSYPYLHAPTRTLSLAHFLLTRSLLDSVFRTISGEASEGFKEEDIEGGGK